MRKSMLCLISLIVLVTMPLIRAEEVDSDSLTLILSPEAQQAEKASSIRIDKWRAEEAQLIKAAAVLFAKKKYDEQDIIRLKAIIRILGTIGTKPAIDLLIRNVDFCDSTFLESRIATAREKYPCAGALMDLGLPCLRPIINALGETDDISKIWIYREILFEACETILGTGPGHRSDPRVLKLAVYLLTSAKDEELREDCVVRLKTNADYFLNLLPKIKK